MRVVKGGEGIGEEGEEGVCTMVEGIVTRAVSANL